MSLTINTKFGPLEYDDIDLNELSPELRNFINKIHDAAGLFFTDAVDMDEFDDNSGVFDEAIETLIMQGKFTEPLRAIAVAKHTGNDLSDITENDEFTFEIESSNETYLVLTDEEADEKALEYNKDILDELGIEDLHPYVYMDYIESEWFDDAMHEYNKSYAYDIKNENSDDTYINRLHEEMVSKGILSEPEWPDESDYEYVREEFDEDEPQESDFDSSDDYEEAYADWQTAETEFNEEQDRLETEAEEEYESAKDEYRTELENDVDNSIDEFIEALNGDYENGIEYWKSNFGEEELARIAKEKDLIDYDGLADYLLETDGRGVLAGYDGQEYSEDVTFKGISETFYIYRTN